MPFTTELTRRLGTRVPVVQGGMQWVGYAELASAVSNAGGLGILTALTQPDPEAFRQEIRRCKTMTTKPFGVNLALLPSLVPPNYHEYVRVIIEEGIRIVDTAGRNSAPIIAQLRSAGDMVVIHKCTTIKHALSACKLGVDFISIDGFECGGHVGESDITNLVLLSKARGLLPVPFIASGGFADGNGLAAALALGAEGICMGTRFLCTVEAPIHQNVKEVMVRASENDTHLILRRWRNSSRSFANRVTKKTLEIEKERHGKEVTDTDFAESGVGGLVSGARGKAVFETGDPDAGVWTAGQVLGLILDTPTCKELIDRIEVEANLALRRIEKARI